MRELHVLGLLDVDHLREASHDRQVRDLHAIRDIPYRDDRLFTFSEVLEAVVVENDLAARLRDKEGARCAKRGEQVIAEDQSALLAGGCDCLAEHVLSSGENRRVANCVPDDLHVVAEGVVDPEEALGEGVPEAEKRVILHNYRSLLEGNLHSERRRRRVDTFGEDVVLHRQGADIELDLEESVRDARERILSDGTTRRVVEPNRSSQELSDDSR